VQKSHPTHTNREVDDTVRLVAAVSIATGVIHVNGVEAVTWVVAPFPGTGHAVRVTVICPACSPAICATFGADAWVMAVTSAALRPRALARAPSMLAELSPI
jgi:hypothetical protein